MSRQTNVKRSVCWIEWLYESARYNYNNCVIVVLCVFNFFFPFVDSKNINWRREDINAVSPLLEAYQTSLEEKDVTIESYKNELARFSSRSREIAAENENLYQQLEEANEKVVI